MEYGKLPKELASALSNGGRSKLSMSIDERRDELAEKAQRGKDNKSF
jgi:hypothetical protein